MGQNTSVSVAENIAQLLNISDSTVTADEINTMSYDEFLNYLGELNKLSMKSVNDSQSNTQLFFAVRKGTDSTLFWRQTIEIACIKRSSSGSSYRILNLKEFLQVFKTLQLHRSAIEESKKRNEHLTVSKIFDNLPDHTSGSIESECSICMERKPDILLPCAHSFCNQCIEEWNETHNTCPICRAKLESADDTWVVSEVPQADEISREIKSTLMNLTENDSPPCSPF